MIPIPRPEALFDPHADDAVLRLPLAELVKRTEKELRQRDFYRQAARSALYGPRWRAAGIKLGQLGGRDALRRLPFISGPDLIAMAASGRSIRKALLARPRIWVTSRGTTAETKKWLPLTLIDTARWFSRVRRLNQMLVQEPGAPSRQVLAVNEPLPRVSNAVPYLWERADYLAGGQQLQFIIAATSMLWRNHWDRFALQKQPHWLMASVADARQLAEELGSDARRLLGTPRRGLFWGEPLDGPDSARSELASTYGLYESFSLYFSAECREMYAECPAHAGLHLWMDGAIHEILLDSKKALFVDQAPPGTEGEYVVTTFGEALPLVRYRTGDRIRVVDTAPCSCGITHPRVTFPGRQA
jgi:phenylacetate-coenzyme A ligase PaaK-like adenylate-forming protein